MWRRKEDELFVDPAPLAPFPVEAGFQAVSPVISIYSQMHYYPDYTLYLSRPVAYVERSFETRNVRLEKLRLPTP